MRISHKDKIALTAAGIAVAAFAIFKLAFFPVWDSLQESRSTLSIQEERLEKYREVARTAGLRTAEVSSEQVKLRQAESGLLTSNTAALASGELEGLVKQLASTEAIDIRSNEFLPLKKLSSDYMEVPLGLQFQCRLEQLVNLLKDIAGSPQYLAVPKLLIQPGSSKEKLISVNMQIAGVMRAEPPKKGNSE